MSVAAAADEQRKPAPAFGVLLAVLGVVYGDIGTSPLYAFRASLQMFHGVPVAAAEIMGILSLIFWSLVLIVTVKYVMLIMRADNRGEGGILALMALAQRVSTGSGMRNALALVGIAGACLFFGDGVITPAISVLSAVEGLEVATPELQQYVLPISVVVIVVLFAVQARGTGSVGRVFGPVMAAVVRRRSVCSGCRDRAASLGPAGGLTESTRSDCCIQYKMARLHRAGRGGAVRDRGGGAVRRHGPFRRASDPAGLAVLRAALRWC